MRVLVAGATGLLGQALVAEAAARGHAVLALSRRGGVVPGGGSVDPVDLTEPASVRRYVERSAPDLVVDAAAMTDVDACEAAPEEARRLHVDAVATLAEAARAARARFVLVSTDSVFSGEGEPWREESGPAPRNAYARTKLDGESAAAAASPEALIVRTNFFGARADAPGRSLAEWALGEWSAGRAVDGFSDVRFNPLWTGHLAKALLDAAMRPVNGVLHVAGRTALSKHEFLRALAATFGFSEALVRPSTQAGRRWRAQRPVCTVLDVTRAETTLGAPMPDLWAGLRDFRAWADARGLPRAGGGDRGPA